MSNVELSNNLNKAIQRYTRNRIGGNSGNADSVMRIINDLIRVIHKTENRPRNNRGNNRPRPTKPSWYTNELPPRNNRPRYAPRNQPRPTKPSWYTNELPPRNNQPRYAPMRPKMPNVPMSFFGGRRPNNPASNSRYSRAARSLFNLMRRKPRPAPPPPRPRRNNNRPPNLPPRPAPTPSAPAPANARVTNNLRKNLRADIEKYLRTRTSSEKRKLSLKYHPNKQLDKSLKPLREELFKEIQQIFDNNPPRNNAPAAAQPRNNSGNRTASSNNSKRQLALRSNLQLVPRPPPIPRPLIVPAPVPARNSNVVKGLKALPGYNTIRNNKVRKDRNNRIARIAKRRKIINRARLALGNPVVRNGEVYFNSRP